MRPIYPLTAGAILAACLAGWVALAWGQPSVPKAQAASPAAPPEVVAAETPVAPSSAGAPVHTAPAFEPPAPAPTVPMAPVTVPDVPMPPKSNEIASPQIPPLVCPRLASVAPTSDMLLTRTVAAAGCSSIGE